MFFKKEKQNPLFELRNQLLLEDTSTIQTAGTNLVSTVIMDVGTKQGGYCLIIVSDGSCSLYFEKGGGVIGCGQHKNVQYACKVALAETNKLMEFEPSVMQFRSDIPKNKTFVIHVITNKGKYELSGSTDKLREDSNARKLFILCNNIITEIRLLEERNNKPFSDDEILISFVKQNNYDAFVYALDDLNNPNAVEEDKSVLMIATYIGNKEIIKKLLDKGADLCFQDGTGLNPLMIACFLGKFEIIDELVNADTINSRDNSGQTPLMFACNADHFECVKALISCNADINAKDNQGSTSIMFAAQHGYDSIVKYLLENGADKNITGEHGFKAVDFAIQNNKKSTVKILSD